MTISLGFLSKEEPPAWSGRMLHGVLFERLGEVDAGAAEEAHSVEPRPFSLSGIYREGAHPVFRCAGLSERVSGALSTAFEVGMEMDIGPSRVRVLDVKREAIGYEELRERFMPEEGSFDRISLRFASPTTFRVGDANMPFPLPRLLWQSWSNRWARSLELEGPSDWSSNFDEYLYDAKGTLEE